MLSAYYYLLVTKYESTGRKLCVGLCACVGEDVKILRVACLRIRSSSNLIGAFLVVCLRNYGVAFISKCAARSIDDIGYPETITREESSEGKSICKQDEQVEIFIIS